MRFDPDKPSYFAWLTSQPGEQQQLSGLGIVCNEQHFDQIRNINTLVTYIRGFVQDAIGISKCFHEVRNVEKALAENAARNRSLALDIPSSLLAHADAQQNLDNFLAAASAYVCRAQTRIRRNFGESSPQFLSFEGSRKFEYDNKISFRVMQNLRNFSQHEDAPISIMPISIKHGKKDRTTISSQVLLAKSDFIHSSRVQPRVKRELAELDGDKIDLVPFIEEYYRSFMIITKKAIEDNIAECKNMCAPMLDIFDSQPVPKVSVPIILRPSKNSEKTVFEISYLPMQEISVFEYILDEIGYQEEAGEGIC